MRKWLGSDLKGGNAKVNVQYDLSMLTLDVIMKTAFGANDEVCILLSTVQSINQSSGETDLVLTGDVTKRARGREREGPRAGFGVEGHHRAKRRSVLGVHPPSAPVGHPEVPQDRAFFFVFFYRGCVLFVSFSSVMD